jgi:hypothetical protein
MRFGRRKRDNDQSILPRYYLYASAAKLDMLYDQIDNDLRKRISVDLGIDLKMVTLNIKQKSKNDSLMSRIQIVEKYLSDKDMIGVPGDSKPYFRASMPMQWGWLSGSTSVVFFVGESNDWLIGLGGSRRHVFGGSPGKSKSLEAHSDAPGLLAVLAVLQDEVKLGVLDSMSVFGYELRPFVIFHPLKILKEVFGLQINPYTYPALHGVRLIRDNMEGPVQQCEYIAKKLVMSSGERIILGSPICVWDPS